MTKKIILVVSAIAAALVGLDKIGVTPIAPGTDLRMTTTPAPASSGSGVRFRHDAGDAKVRFQIVVATAEAGVPSWRASLAGKKLEALAKPLEGRRWRLTITARGPGDKDDQKFLWPAGRELTVTAGPSHPSLSLLDWRAFVQDGPFDSRRRAQWRRSWFWLSLIILGLSMAGGVYSLLGKDDTPEALTPEDLLERIILTIRGRDEEDTERIRALLQELTIRGAGRDSALDALGPWDKPLDRIQFFLRAKGLLKSRVRFFRDGLTNVLQRLAMLDR